MTAPAAPAVPGSQEERDWLLVLRAADRPGGSPVAGFLDAAVRVGAGSAPTIVGCSITQDRDGTLSTPAAAGAVARTLDEAQYRSGRGPCVDTARDGTARALPLIGRGDGYPEFASAALLTGVRSSLSLPLVPGSSLNVYAADGDALTGGRPATTLDLLRRALTAVLHDHSPHAPADAAGTPAVERAYRSQRDVRDAQAVLMRSTGVERVQAYAELARRTKAQRRRLLDVAKDLLGPRGTPAPQEAPNAWGHLGERDR